MRRLFVCLIALMVAAPLACRREDSTKEAVRAAIEAHLAQRQNLMVANLAMEIQEIKISGDTAEAEVKYRSKQASDLQVNVHYRLRKTEQGWKVESSSSPGMGGSPHGGAGPVPEHGAPASEPQSSH